MGVRSRVRGGTSALPPPTFDLEGQEKKKKMKRKKKEEKERQ